MGISPPTFYFNEYFTPYLKDQIAEKAKPCRKTQYLLNIFRRKVACIKIHVAFLGKLPRFIQLVYIN